MPKNSWKILLYSNPSMRIAAKFGAYGENAQQAAEEVEKELAPVFLAVFAILAVGLLVWGIVSLLT